MINLFAVLFGLYLLCLLILVYQRKKQGDMNSFDKESAEKERRKDNDTRMATTDLQIFVQVLLDSPRQFFVSHLRFELIFEMFEELGPRDCNHQIQCGA